jgi:hypothetical protein
MNNNKLETWDEWKDNFCQHISDWSYFSACEELEKIKKIIYQQALEEGKRIGRKEVIEKTKNLIKEEFPKFEGNPEDDIRRERYEIGPDEECIKFCDDVYEMCRKKALSLLTHLNKDE